MYIIIVVSLAIIAAVVWYQRRQQAYTSISAPSGPPVRIDLMRRVNPGWRDSGNVELLLAPLLRRGFVLAGWFDVSELPGLQIEGLVNHKHLAYAAVYEGSNRATWAEIVSYYDDGSSFLCTNNPLGSQESHPSNHRVRVLPGSDTGALFDVFIKERPEGKLRSVSEDEFAQEFEDAYIDEMDWRLLRAETSDDEIRKLSGKSFSDEELQTVRQRARRNSSTMINPLNRKRRNTWVGRE